MTIESVRRTKSGFEMVSDGATVHVPDDMRNMDRQAIADWEAAGNTIAPYVAPPPERRRVAKSLIVERLNAAGLLAAAKQALSADLYAQERWYAPGQPAVYADDPETLALLNAIGADAATILAP